jgi:hypothetical protein
MNRTIKKQILDSMGGLLSSRNPYIATQAALILLAAEGVWVNEAITSQTSSKGTAQLCLARQHVYERLEAKRVKRKIANRKAYLVRRLKQLKEQGKEQSGGA